MRSKDYRYLIMFAAIVALLPQQESGASSVIYTWSGRLQLLEPSSPDPWGIGSDGAAFIMSTTVKETAADINPTQVPFAQFNAVSSSLWLDGNQLLYVGGAAIDFSDNAGGFDIISMGGSFSQGTESLSLGSVVGLPSVTFSFFNTSESPPLFGFILTTSRSINASSPYAAFVEAGTAVTAVPEPSSVINACLLYLTVAALKLAASSFRPVQWL